MAHDDQELYRPLTPQHVNTLLLQVLLEMQNDAADSADDDPVGLYRFCQHIRRRDGLPDDPRNHEVQWTREMTRKLVAQGMPAEAEVRYPDGAQRCDVVMRPAASVNHWVEVKGSWTFLHYDPRVPNTSFRKHLGAAADDIDKLTSLSAEVASGVSMVLVSFDDADHPLRDADLVTVASKTTSWLTAKAEWWCDGPARCRTRVHVWTKA